MHVKLIRKVLTSDYLKLLRWLFTNCLNSYNRNTINSDRGKKTLHYRHTHFGYRLVIYSHAVIDQHRSLITQLIRQIYIFIIAWYNIFLFFFEVDRKNCRYYLMELCLIITDIWETISLRLCFVLRITINFFFYLTHTYLVLFFITLRDYLSQEKFFQPLQENIINFPYLL